MQIPAGISYKSKREKKEPQKKNPNQTAFLFVAQISVLETQVLCLFVLYLTSKRTEITI